MPTNGNPAQRINASPTKEFFIHTLTRDVPLSRAILDLVDNCVDGARRIRTDGNFAGLAVSVELDSEHFRVSDNCGGISVDIARNSAFRFGRPPNAEETPGSIGQFGVGMKRSIFKLGREFRVESVTSTSRFRVEVDVDLWMAEDGEAEAGDWHFQFSHLEEPAQDVPTEEIGTRIEIRRLLPSIADSFRSDIFRSRLADEIAVAHSLNLDCGLAIRLNGVPVGHEPQKLLRSETLEPAFVEKRYEPWQIEVTEGPSVIVRLYAGVSERNIHDGGWYIFCNGRLVVRADQSATTVWGKPHSMRQYHPDFAFFRGYAYFDCDNSAFLPWTTTKTGVDTDSAIYKLVQREMIEMTKPVLDFLSRLAEQRDADNAGEWSDKRLEQAMREAPSVRALTVARQGGFVAPQPQPRPPGPRMQKIQYSKPAELVEKAKQLLGVTTFTAVGERTFDYYLEYEGDE